MPGELRTLIVILITTATMVVEIVAGVAFGSMALLADGLHMASHASALAISLFAYVYARRHAHDERFCFGTGKVNSLAGFTGAVLLALFALLMAWESAARLLNPVDDRLQPGNRRRRPRADRQRAFCLRPGRRRPARPSRRRSR